MTPTQPRSASRRRCPTISEATTAALLGVVLAGAFGLLGPWILQRQQNGRDDRQSAEQTRGAARLMSTELKSSGAAIDVFAHDGYLRPFDATMTVDVPTADEQAVAQALTGDQWTDVSIALSNINGLQGMTASLLAQHKAMLTKEQSCTVEYDVVSIAVAAQAVAKLAGDTSPPQIPADPGCDTGNAVVLRQP